MPSQQEDHLSTVDRQGAYKCYQERNMDHIPDAYKHIGQAMFNTTTTCLKRGADAFENAVDADSSQPKEERPCD